MTVNLSTAAMALAEELTRMVIIGYENERQGNTASGIHGCQSCYKKAKELEAALERMSHDR